MLSRTRRGRPSDKQADMLADVNGPNTVWPMMTTTHKAVGN